MHKGNTAPNPVSKSAKAFTEKTKKEPTTSDADDHANRQHDALGGVRRLLVVFGGSQWCSEALSGVRRLSVVFGGSRWCSEALGGVRFYYIVLYPG